MLASRSATIHGWPWASIARIRAAISSPAVASAAAVPAAIASPAKAAALRSPVVLPQRALLLAHRFTLADRRTLVVLLLALGEPDLELDPPRLVMQVDRRQRESRALDLADEAVDLLAVHQQLARARRVGLHVRRRRRQRRHVQADPTRTRKLLMH